MGSIIDDFGDPDRSSRATTFQRLAHLLPVAMVCFVVYTLLFRLVIIETKDWWVTALFIAVYLPIVITAGAHYELARLCIKCMEAVPADAAVRVQKKIFWLKMYHWTLGWRFLIVFVGYSLVMSVIRVLLGLTDQSYSYLNIPMDFLVVGWLMGQYLHHRYRPWCPYCRRWDEGGDHEHAPDPVIPATKVS